jgi:tellurite methyltransferase
MNYSTLQELAGDTDIYLLDQILKRRYSENNTLLDAGCGSGRNLHWFLKSGIRIYGIDQDPGSIGNLKQKNPALAEDSFQVSTVENIPFKNDFFDHIISNAVLHFAKNTTHFTAMIAEMIRVLKPNGSLFIRMTSDIGIEEKVKLIGDGLYYIPDNTKRFLLTRSLLNTIMQQHHLSFLEPLKTVNVNDVRCMSTLVLQKNQIIP